MVSIFYQNNNFTSYSITNSKVGTYYLNIPNHLGDNLQLFQKLHKEDNAKKGISSTSNETSIREQLLSDIKEVNLVFQYFNKGQVYSKNKLMKELPIKELSDVLSNSQFDINKYKDLTQRIENIINENYRIMFDPSIRKDSIKETLTIIENKETNKEFIVWLKENLENREYDYLHTIEEFRKQFEREQIKLDISEFKQVTSNGSKFIVGKNSKGSYFTTFIPNNMDMKKLFEYELSQIDKKMLIGKTGKEVSKILFDIIIEKYPSKKMEINKEIELTDNNNNEKENRDFIKEYGDGGIHQTKIESYSYNEENSRPNELPTEEDVIPIKENYNSINQEKKTVKKLVRTPIPSSSSSIAAFIKVGTVILFSASALLIIAAIILVIVS